MKVLVGGGTGFIGKTLVRGLEARGHNVTIISRRPGVNTITWSEVEKQGLPEQSDAVVNVAGELLMNPLRRWNENFIKDLESSRIGTNKILVDAMKASAKKPEVFVSSSAIGYYEIRSTEDVTENSAGGTDYMCDLCRRWEASAQMKDVRNVAIRTGLVLGREGGLLKEMYLPFYLGLGGKLGTGKQWFPWVHVKDVSGIFIRAIENKEMSGVYNAVAPGFATNETFTKTLASAMWRPSIFTVPVFSLRIIFGYDRANAMLIMNSKVIPERTLQAGYQFAYPDLKSAIAECLK